MIKYSFALLFLAFFAYCTVNPERIPENVEPAYFPIKEFLEVQAQKLDNKGIRKLLIIKGSKETIEETLSEEQWLQELELFLQADINKAALIQSYNTKHSDEYLIHELKSSEKGKIKKIVVRYEGELVKEITFHAIIENLFYSSRTRGVLFTHSETGLLDQINIESTQTVLFLSPNKMVVTASVQSF